jgi:adenosylmethionine-8-amino-7-oxononanoate aminotransferase
MTADTLADTIADRIEFEGPETVSAVILEPVQNSGGCFTPPEGYFQKVREICDHYGVLFISDEVICSWGRLGTYFGAERFGYEPDIITTAKGITSSYAPMGAVIASDKVFEPFSSDKKSFAHGLTFGGHPVSAAVALANIAVFENEGNPRERAIQRGRLRGDARGAARHPDRGDVRGMGYFRAIELVKNREPRSPSPTRNPSGCCAASCRASCSGAA